MNSEEQKTEDVFEKALKSLVEVQEKYLSKVEEIKKKEIEFCKEKSKNISSYFLQDQSELRNKAKFLSKYLFLKENKKPANSFDMKISFHNIIHNHNCRMCNKLITRGTLYKCNKCLKNLSDKFAVCENCFIECMNKNYHANHCFEIVKNSIKPTERRPCCRLVENYKGKFTNTSHFKFTKSQIEEIHKKDDILRLEFTVQNTGSEKWPPSCSIDGLTGYDGRPYVHISLKSLEPNEKQTIEAKYKIGGITEIGYYKYRNFFSFGNGKTWFEELFDFIVEVTL